MSICHCLQTKTFHTQPSHTEWHLSKCLLQMYLKKIIFSSKTGHVLYWKRTKKEEAVLHLYYFNAGNPLSCLRFTHLQHNYLHWKNIFILQISRQSPQALHTHYCLRGNQTRSLKNKGAPLFAVMRMTTTATTEGQG